MMNESQMDTFISLSLIGDGECWPWPGKKDKNGYGRCRTEYGRTTGAHRMVYEEFIGPTDGGNVLHRCDNPSCVNPDHLFLGSQSDNVRDAINKGRWPLRGEKLDWDKSREIRESSETNGVLADRYGVDRSVICRIKNLKAWVPHWEVVDD